MIKTFQRIISGSTRFARLVMTSKSNAPERTQITAGFTRKNASVSSGRPWANLFPKGLNKRASRKASWRQAKNKKTAKMSAPPRNIVEVIKLNTTSGVKSAKIAF
jgi:hypothetical protein